MARDNETGTNFRRVIARSQVLQLSRYWVAADAPVVKFVPQRFVQRDNGSLGGIVISYSHFGQRTEMFHACKLRTHLCHSDKTRDRSYSDLTCS